MPACLVKIHVIGGKYMFYSGVPSHGGVLRFLVLRACLVFTLGQPLVVVFVKFK